MYVFPGIGLASILCKAKHISQEMIYTSATSLSSTLTDEEFESGMLYPDLERIRAVSVVVARDVIREAQRQKLDREPSLRGMTDAELDGWIKDRMYDPRMEDGFLELKREEVESALREAEVSEFVVREKLVGKL